MNTNNFISHTKKSLLLLAVSIAGIVTVTSNELGSMIDDFGDSKKTKSGMERIYLDDKAMGGKTQVKHQIKNGILSVEGEILPPRGQPGWASIVFILDPKGLPKDATKFKGVRLRIKVKKGNISISANSSKITNYDFHSSQILHKRDGKFHVVEIPFSKMKRAWFAQTKLDKKTLTGCTLSAFGIQKGAFAYEVDQISFY